MSAECCSNHNSDHPKPKAGAATFPMVLVMILALVSYYGCTKVDQLNGGFSARVFGPYLGEDELMAMSPSAMDLLKEKGKSAYAKAGCVACHQANGLGSDAQNAPPLAASDWVMASESDRLIRIVLHGISGPIQVSGKEYGKGVMPPLGAVLNDEEVAAVLTYIRNEWGNAASEVKTEKAAAIRAATATRGGAPWSASELLAIPLSKPGDK